MRGSTVDVPPFSDEATSVLLRRVVAALPSGDIRIGYLVRQLRRHSFGGMFILLACLALLPGISAFAGLALLVPAVQLAIGMRAPLLPRRLRRRTVKRETLQSVGERLIPWLERVERLVRPRWLAMTRAPFPSITGVLVVGLALVIMLPLPFSNLPPAVSILALAVGLIERDGVLIGAGFLTGMVALVIGVIISLIAVNVGLALVA